MCTNDKRPVVNGWWATGLHLWHLYNAARTSNGLTFMSISNFVCLLELGIYNFACGSAVMLSVMDHTNITQGSKN